MSASYWCSSQRQKWQYTRDQLTRIRADLGDNCNVHNRIFLHSLIVKLGGKLNLRQVILSTAEVFLNRFLTRATLKEVNAYLLVTTCIYLGCKIEESPVHIRNIVNESRNAWPEFIPSDPTKLAEFEFYLIEEMDCYMVIHHPYNSLVQIVQVLKTGDFKVGITSDEQKIAWSIVNDSYITDLPLLFPPHITAIAAVYMACILMDDNIYKNQRVNSFIKFLAVSNVDLDEVIEAVQEMLTLYENWNGYDEISIRNSLNFRILSLNNA
ncbi:unnamed protein product [Kuraishia capsulata CBS 1993]|uniref:Cyclin-like domain-containing protein n=1 Tax=Kuraishia capsulata CBS 1993 TaxID=1382522 RepID=W6MRR0_9ASCO|nr:uncharacterized protein KUCA_T00005397001 [Kuraishia capsulata CBS 1993]CDK29409.1 unnamed protein product [Kuraishia capsulata CBS 1993]